MPVRVPPGAPRAGAPALRGGPAGVPHVSTSPARSSTSIASWSWPRTTPGAERPGQGPAAPGRAGPAQAGLSDGAGRRPAGRRPDGGRGLEPLDDPAVARDPGRLGRADPAAPPRRGAGRPGAQARTDRSPGGARPLPAGPGDRRRPARGHGRPGPHAARPAHGDGRPGAGRPHPPALDAPAPRRLRAAHVRRRPQAQRRAPAPRRRHPDRRGQPRPSSTTCTSRRATRSAMPS